MIRVLLVDDQPLVRSGLRMILEAEPDIAIVAEAGDGSEAVTAVDHHRVDVVLMDVHMPRMDGLAATRVLLQRGGPSPRIVMLTTFDDDAYVYEALRLGASGYLLKSVPTEQLAEAVRVVARGDALLAPSVTRRLIASFAARPVVGPEHAQALEGLTPREHQMLLLLARGESNAEIAERLVLSLPTIKTHVANLLGKLSLRDRTQAVVFAYENGLITPGAPP